MKDLKEKVKQAIERAAVTGMEYGEGLVGKEVYEEEQSNCIELIMKQYNEMNIKNPFCPAMSGTGIAEAGGLGSKFGIREHFTKVRCVKEECAWWIKEVTIDFKSVAKGMAVKDLGPIENIVIEGHCGRVDPQSPTDKGKIEAIGRLIAEAEKMNKSS